MKFTATKLDVTKTKNGVLVFATEKGELLKEAKAFDKHLGGIVSEAIKNSRFDGGMEETLVINTGKMQIVVVGLGADCGKKNINDWRRNGLFAAKSLDSLASKEVTIIMEDAGKLIKPDSAAEAVMEGLNLGLYRFENFKTTLTDKQKPVLSKIEFMTTDVSGTKTKIALVDGQTTGANLARDLVNNPPNVATPAFMVKHAKTFAKLGIKVEVLGEKELKKIGMGMLLAVGQGSEEESQVIIMKYTGASKKEPYKAIVGKGVMFDTGGYDLKPPSGMLHMKSDMAGAAAVMGTMLALAKRGSKVNVIGVCGCVTNRVSHNAFLPSDIVTSHKGLTVEIGNTDAEGRLVLGDCMSYIIEKEKPAEIIDLATLTGACVMALGSCYAGMFSEHDSMLTGMKKAADATGEYVWQLPLGKHYSKLLKSKIADMCNVASASGGGASTAAAFLQKFVGDTPWMHLDIAGVSMTEKSPSALPVNGATGFGVRLLVNYLEQNA